MAIRCACWCRARRTPHASPFWTGRAFWSFIRRIRERKAWWDRCFWDGWSGVLPDVKAAFVKLGLRQNGFLPLREAESYHRTSGSASLMTGQDVLVQVKKDPKGEKAAFLTRDIGLPGQYVLLMPRNRFVGLSRRVTGEEDRARAQALGRRIADGRFGLIVRHAALFAPVAEVEAEAEACGRCGVKPRSARGTARPPPCCTRSPRCSACF